MYIVAINIWNTLALMDVAVMKSGISKYYLYLGNKITAFESLSSVVQSSGLIWVIDLVFDIEKVLWVHFSLYIVFLKNFRQ